MGLIDITGQRFGKLVALEYIGKERWRTICDCGNEKIVRGDHLRSGVTQSCGCYASEIMRERHKQHRLLKAENKITIESKPRIDITNKKFNHLTTIEYVGNGKWLFKCDCGNLKIIHQNKVRSNKTKSCGNCNAHNRPRNEKDITHKSWVSMIRRCKSKRPYLDKGIKVCDRWLGEKGFEHFVHDMGERPSSKHSIDRIDVYGDYCPENCRWANQKEQCNNKSNNIYISHNGDTKTLAQWCAYFGLPYKRCNSRYMKGLPFEAIFSPDVRKPSYTRDEILSIRERCLTKSQFEKMFNKYISHDMIGRIRRRLAYYNIE
jgi:hypothetical protein